MPCCRRNGTPNADYFRIVSGALPHDGCAQTLQFCAPSWPNDELIAADMEASILVTGDHGRRRSLCYCRW